MRLADRGADGAAIVEGLKEVRGMGDRIGPGVDGREFHAGTEGVPAVIAQPALDLVEEMPREGAVAGLAEGVWPEIEKADAAIRQPTDHAEGQ